MFVIRCLIKHRFHPLRCKNPAYQNLKTGVFLTGKQNSFVFSILGALKQVSLFCFVSFLNFINEDADEHLKEQSKLSAVDFQMFNHYACHCGQCRCKNQVGVSSAALQYPSLCYPVSLTAHGHPEWWGSSRVEIWLQLQKRHQFSWLLSPQWGPAWTSHWISWSHFSWCCQVQSSSDDRVFQGSDAASCQLSPYIMNLNTSVVSLKKNSLNCQLALMIA